MFILSDEIIREILLNLSTLSLAKISKSCSRISKITNTEYFWQLKHEKDFPTRRKTSELTFKHSYIDWYRVEISGLFTDTAIINGPCPVSLFKSSVFPIDITITYSFEGEENFNIESDIFILQNIDDAYYTDVPKGIYEIREHNKGDTIVFNSPKTTVTLNEAQKFINKKLSEGYIAYDRNNNENYQNTLRKLRDLGLTREVEYEVITSQFQNS